MDIATQLLYTVIKTFDVTFRFLFRLTAAVVLMMRWREVAGRPADIASSHCKVRNAILLGRLKMSSSMLLWKDTKTFRYKLIFGKDRVQEGRNAQHRHRDMDTAMRRYVQHSHWDTENRHETLCSAQHHDTNTAMRRYAQHSTTIRTLP
jgi:hypothetical protein